MKAMIGAQVQGDPATTAGPVLRTRPQPDCPVCGQEGVVVFGQLKDNLFGVVGTWTSRECSGSDCGLFWLDPAPLEEDLGLAYGNYFTHVEPAAQASPSPARRAWEAVKQGHFSRRFGYPIQGAAWKRVLSLLLLPFPTRRESLDVLALHLRSVRNGHILEIGCGAGHSLVTLQSLGWNAEGFDFDPQAGGVARASGIVVRTGTLEGQRYPDARFDAIAMIHSIEHIPNPVAFLREVRRILKPGGQLVLITPNVNSLGRRRFQESWLGLDAPRHVQVFSCSSLRKAASEAGFQTSRMFTTARMASYLHSEGRRIETGLAPGAGEVSSSLVDRLFQMRERLALLIDRNVGEEIIFLGR